MALLANETKNFRYLGLIDSLNEESAHRKDPAYAAQHKNRKMQTHFVLEDGHEPSNPVPEQQKPVASLIARRLWSRCGKQYCWNQLPYICICC